MALSRGFAGPAFLLLSLAGATSLALAACAVGSGPSPKRQVAEPGADYYDNWPAEQQPLQPTYVNDDSGAFGANSRPAAGSKDAAVDAARPDASAKIRCTEPLRLGDLAVVEMLIASRTGAGDDGEWLEVRNMRDCWLDAKGVSVESPRGTTGLDVAHVDETLELAPGETFVVTNTPDSPKAFGGTVVVWNDTDVLKNDGDTVTVKLGATVLDQLTYPRFTNLQVGRSVAFPDDCPAAARTDWQRWSLSFHEWAPGMTGTPNGTNDDVACY